MNENELIINPGALKAYDDLINQFIITTFYKEKIYFQIFTIHIDKFNKEVLLISLKYLLHL